MNKLGLMIVMLLPVFGFAQDPDFGVDIKVEKPRTVATSTKITTLPKVVDTTVEVPTHDYPLLSKQAFVNTEITPIQPARLKIIEPITKLYKGYVKAGFGMYSSPFLDVHFMEARNRNASWGIRGKHFSSRDAHKDYNFSGFADNHLKLYGSKFLEYFTLSGDLVFDHNAVHHYGTMNDTTINRDMIKQRFTNFEFNGRIKSYFEDSLHLDRDIRLGYYYFQDYKDEDAKMKYDFGREHHVDLKATMGKYLNKEYLEGNLNLDYNNYKNDTLNPCIACDTTTSLGQRGNAILNLGFRIISQRDKFKFKAGLKVDVDMPDPNTSNPKLYAFPDAELKYSLFNDIFIPYVGVTRELKRNSFRSIARDNPFILSSVDLINTNNVYKLYGGIRGTLSSKTDFNLGVSTGLYRSVPLYWRDSTYSFNNRFEVRYDTMTITKFTGELSYHNGEALKIYGKGEYFIYGAGREDMAWYLPQYKFSLGATYDMKDKIIAKFNTYVLGGRHAGTYEPQEGQTGKDGVYSIDLGTFVDINLGVEYRYTKRLSAYLNFNNILAKKYQIYQDYPLQGINILGGITWSF